ncbi:hypothetical protein NM688_g5858 [Phlebia brevispora]|uniref:Uncharacterized protein n=1 Tax=Phlebia brevispora TaxID=194682 RepID=A0ACC1SNI3_9APHY|nr:hypothetical protein NM688_g5858 [Phlebia brevispora]
MSQENKVYLDIFMGDQDVHATEQAQYDSTCALLSKNAAIYGLPASPAELTEEQQQILAELDSSLQLRFTAPPPLCVGRLVLKLDPAQGLAKTRANFIALCTGEKGSCKNAWNKKLHYMGCPMHRIVKAFVAQGGDITRGDGSGGESIYGGKFNDEKEGLKRKMHRGSLAMANSGKNTNSSQFFVVLTDDEAKLAKMNGKYVVFGEAVSGLEVLERLNEVGGGADGRSSVPVWIGYWMGRVRVKVRLFRGRGQRTGIKRNHSRKALSGSCTVLSLFSLRRRCPPYPSQTLPHKLRSHKLALQAEDQRKQITALSEKIQAAEVDLERLVKDSRCAITELEKQRTAMENRLAHTLAYLSPIRRLPNEILSQIFMLVFEDLPCCAWVLSSVSSLWRRRVLSMPKLWSKIRLVTTQSASADTIRLWLERSGSTVPLDIEIFLHAPPSSSNEPNTSRSRPSTATLHTPTVWEATGGHAAGWAEWNQPPNTPEVGTPNPGHLHVYPAAVLALTPAAVAAATPPPTLAAQAYGHELILPSFSWRQAAQQAKSRASMHWGHIAFYYLTEQIHRWERFVFRFDKRFTSVDALKSVTRRCCENSKSLAQNPDFSQHLTGHGYRRPSLVLQSTSPTLDTLTLQFVPFKWSSPMFHNLRVLSLRAPSQ